MNNKLQNILDIIQQCEKLDAEQKDNLIKAVEDADKELEITAFKLERTEKVKKTTAILLEETIEELEQKRKAVEEQNRELEIEASLERVRAVAMSMNKSDDLLSICEISFKEFQKLGFNNLRNAIIHILNDEKGFFLDYDYSDYLGGSINKVNYNSHPIVENYLKQIKRADDAFAEVVIDGNQLDGWKQFRRRGGQPDDPRLQEIPALYYYLYSIGVGDIGISTFSPIDEYQIKILERFRNVFDLAYRTFTDINKAEAQAREGKIQLALEKVRMVALGLNKSIEMLEVAKALYEQLLELGFSKIRNAIIDIKNGDADTFTDYDYSHEMSGTITQMSYHDDPTLEGQFKKMATTTNDFFELVLEGKELEDLVNMRLKNGEAQDPRLLNIDLLTYNLYSFGNGAIGISNFGVLSAEEKSILSRFSNVFTFAYKRYNDLASAEAQAREAQIEAALERVRSRTMGMQKSEELKEVIQLVYEQFVHLNIHIEHTGFIMDYKARDDMYIWLADKHEVPFQLTIPYFDCAHWNSFIEAKEKGLHFFANHLTFEEKNKFYQDLFKLISGVPEETLEYYFNCPGLAISTVFLDNVGLYIENFSGIPYSDEENNTLMRFGKVFQQTYTRFLDLQKAEEQAREAQIETALEKIRNRTLLMKDSTELNDAVAVFFEQFKDLELIPSEARTYFSHVNPNTDTVEVWMTHTDGRVMSESHITPMTKSPQLKEFYNKWKNNKEVINIRVYKEQDLLDYMHFLTTLPHVAKDEDYQKLFKTPPDQIVMTDAGFLHGFLGIMSYESLEKEAIDLLARFAKVFEFTYTRFLDLQKAEVQAREAQIEAALENVRSRSLAMHKSDEIKDVVVTVMEKMNELKIEMNGGVSLATFIEGSEDLLHWYVNPDHVDGPVAMHLPYFENVLFHDFIEARKSGKEILPVVYSFKQKNEYFQYTFEHSDFRIIPEELKKWILEQPYFGYSVAIQKHSAIFFNDYTGKLFSEKENDVLIRFAKVFDQAYIRFLDLQQAEVQAREAQIEAALEKVRSRTMAMQHSDELADTASVLFEQFVTLSIVPKRCSIGIINKETQRAKMWLTSTDGKVIPGADLVPLNEEEHLIGLFKAWGDKKEIYSFSVKGEERLKWTQYIIEKAKMHLPEYQPDTIDTERILNEPAYLNSFTFSHGFIMLHTVKSLSEKDLPVLKRFAGVFEQTYTRFLDLKNAELQAREAEQQASLDRVRAEIASMRTTEDLEKITPLIWYELTSLNVPFFRCGLFIIDESTEITHLYLSTPSGESLAAMPMKFNSSKLVREAVNHWRKGKVYKDEWNQQQFIEWTTSRINQQLITSAEQYQAGKEAPESLILHLVPFRQGMLYVGSKQSLSNDEIELVQKLADAFGVAYSRYEDFQKLEVAKAKIESAFSDLDDLSRELKVKNEVLEIENNRKAIELEEARQLQLSMLPKELPQLPDLDIAVYMQTATEVGGDYYDFQVGLDGTLITVIGDATGHGMKAGTVVTITKSLFNSMAANESILSTFDKISQVLKGMKFRHLAMCLLMMKIKGNRLSISSAAMPPALIYRSKKKSVEEIFLKGMPLGTINKFPYKKIESHLNSGDRILLYSDGLPELANEDDEMFGYNRIKTEFHSVGEKEPEEIVNHLKNSASQWVNSKEPDDDVTFVVIKVK